VVCAVSLVPALIVPDMLDAELRHRNQIPADLPLARIHEALTTGPLAAARLVGVSIGTHSAQAWPPGWPPYLARDAKVCLFFIPFWFVVGLPFVETLLWLSRRGSRVRESRA
jgi:hypothetical protein